METARATGGIRTPYRHLTGGRLPVAMRFGVEVVGLRVSWLTRLAITSPLSYGARLVGESFLPVARLPTDFWILCGLAAPAECPMAPALHVPGGDSWPLPSAGCPRVRGACPVWAVAESACAVRPAGPSWPYPNFTPQSQASLCPHLPWFDCPLCPGLPVRYVHGCPELTWFMGGARYVCQAGPGVT